MTKSKPDYTPETKKIINKARKLLDKQAVSEKPELKKVEWPGGLMKINK